MFAWWGRMVYHYRFIVMAVTVGLCLAGGVFGMTLGNHVTQSGFYDDGSESARASRLSDEVYGRDTSGHIVAIYTAPEGKTVDDPEFMKKIVDNLDQVQRDEPDRILRSVGYFRTPDLLSNMADADKKHAFMSIQLKGNDDDTILNNYKAVKDDFKIDGVDVKLAGLQPLAAELTGTIGEDQKRAEVLALPLVAVVLFMVFGGVVAASLPCFLGGLSIAGALGILRVIAFFGPVHYFAQPVVTLVGLGIAIDYGLFVVSRFREELAEGYDTEAAVRRTVMTAGRTVVFSAVIVVASAAGLLLFPQGFLKSITYAVIFSVSLAALLSITLLPATLAVLGRHVDALGPNTLLKYNWVQKIRPFRAYLVWLSKLVQKTKTREEIENGFWGKLIPRVMKHPILYAAPIIIILVLLIIPLGQLQLGGISEKYLPPNNSVRLAQEEFDSTFPGFRTQPLTLVIKNNDGNPVTDVQVADVRNEAMAISGFSKPEDDPDKMWVERPFLDGASKDPSVRVIQNGLVNPGDARQKIDELRSIQPPRGLTLWVGGTPTLEQDSIHSLFDRLPQMLILLITTTTLLMFLAFGSLVLPVKAALMSALTLGSTLGILTWIFVEGHGSGILNFTPTPLTAPVIGLIIAVIYGLSTDYEVFLVSRMVEARERGMSTPEAIRIGTATTGRIITAAAAILIVVAGAFVFSDLVMMKYLAFGLIAALILDATVVRMFLVPAIMKLLGDDCWWAPRWMKRLQERIGLGEIHLSDERKRPAVRDPEEALVAVGAAPSALGPHDPTHPEPDAPVGPVGPAGSGARRALPRRIPPQPPSPSVAGTTRMPGRPPEPPTTRLSAPGEHARSIGDAGPTAVTQRPRRPAPPKRDDYEIESWLGELRSTDRGSGPHPPPPPPSRPSAEPTRGIPEARPPADEKTTALPVHRTGVEERGRAGRNKLPQAEDEMTRRGDTGVSAQDLLRREGRL